VIKNYLGTLDKLHKTLVVSVDEINSQSIFHHSYTIVCHPYITIKIIDLHNDICQMKNVWNFVFYK
jgi:hypothetical protein